jgi:PKD repeat protein
MNRRLFLNLFFFLAVAACIGLIPPAMATTELHVVKYADDRTTVISETTVTWQWMRDHLPVLGDGTTHYYHQGPVFADDAASPAHQEELRWNRAEDTNVQEKDYGAVMGTNLKDICDLVGGLSPGEEVTLKASDGLTKKFAYRNVYQYPARQGPMGITWSRDGTTPDAGYDEGMKLVFFADSSVNPWGIHAFGNADWRESADSQYWYYYYQGTGNKFPTTTGLAVKYISDVIIYSSTPASEVQPPVAAFSATPLTGTAPLTVQFTDQSTGSPTSWSWDFTNDGTADSTQQSPSFAFTTAGTYTVKLTSTNAYGSTSETKTGYITVSPSGSAPVAAFSAAPVSGTAPLTVRFTDRSIGSPTSWSWDFTNDGTADSTQRNVSYIFTSAGTYSVKLTSTNAYGSTTETKTGYITVSSSGSAPVAAFSATPLTGTAPLTVQFTDQSTGSPTSWSWDFTNDGTADSTQQNPSFAFTTAGTYTVKLTSTNSYGSTSETRTGYITVSSSVPAPVAQFSASPVSGPAPLTVQFTDHSTGSPVSWSWDFTSDGTVDSTSASPSYTYTNGGTFTVTLTTTNAAGTTAQNSTSVQVAGQQPAAGFSADVTSGTFPLAVQFTDSSAGVGISAWSWDFNNDGVIDSTDKNPRYTFTAAGIYPVNLTVTGTYGTSSVVKAQYIRVTAAQNPGITAAPAAAQQQAATTTAPASVQQTTVKKGRTTVVTTVPGVAETSPESPGPDAECIVGTLVICGLGTVMVRKYRHAKR